MSLTIGYSELELVRTFRNRVSNLLPDQKLRDDHFLVRWIRARDLNLDEAESMLRKSMDWLYRNEMDRVLEWKPKTNIFRYAMPGRDAFGCPVFIIPVGYWEIYKALETGDLFPAFRTCLKMLARIEYEIKRSSQELQLPITQCVIIVDCQDLACLRHLNNRTVVQAAIEFFRVCQANYPGILKSCTFVNTSRLFSLIFAVMKPFIMGNTGSKIHSFGNQRKKWIDALEEKVPMEILPPFYGGTRQGVDEFCSNSRMWNDGEPLPANYYGNLNGNKSQNKTVSVLDIGSSRTSVYSGIYD